MNQINTALRREIKKHTAQKRELKNKPHKDEKSKQTESNK